MWVHRFNARVRSPSSRTVRTFSFGAPLKGSEFLCGEWHCWACRDTDVKIGLAGALRLYRSRTPAACTSCDGVPVKMLVKCNS